MSNVKGARKGLLAQLAIGIALLLLGSQAFASPTAANAQLEAKVTVSYQDLGSNPYSGTASATVTVALLPVAPTLAFSSSNPADLLTLSENQSFTIDYTITSNSNGLDTYTFSTSATSPTNLTPGTFTAPFTLSTLGATIAVEAYSTTMTASGTGLEGDCLTGGGTGLCTIKVANDDASDSSVNGIVATDTVVMGGNTCTVDHVTDNGGNITDVSLGTGYSEIFVNNCSATTALAVGDGLFERQTVTASLNSGSVVTTPTQGDAYVSTTSNDSNSNTSNQVDTHFIVFPANLVVNKLVRNFTNAVAGSSSDPGVDGNGNQLIGALTVDGATFYKSGVTAKPGEVLEYAIVVVNEGGDVQDVKMVDPLNVFTTYSAGSMRVMHEGDISCGTPNAWTCSATIDTSTVASESTPLDGASDGDAGKESAGQVTIYGGIGGTDSSGTGGTVAHNKISIGFYKASVN